MNTIGATTAPSTDTANAEPRPVKCWTDDYDGETLAVYDRPGSIGLAVLFSAPDEETGLMEPLRECDLDYSLDFMSAWSMIHSPYSRILSEEASA